MGLGCESPQRRECVQCRVQEAKEVTVWVCEENILYVNPKRRKERVERREDMRNGGMGKKEAPFSAEKEGSCAKAVRCGWSWTQKGK